MIKGYKAFDKKLMCRDFKFKVGKTYEIEDELQICQNGFHFCENLLDVYNYYPKDAETRICEIEAVGKTIKENDKSVTSKIKIVRELSDSEKLDAVLKRGNSGYENDGNRNSGYGNSGYGNSGSRNSGNRNSGDWNSGDGNSGNRNSGYGNSGTRNSGNRNSGYGNSGSRNSGNRNSGDWNSGDWNSGNRNSGYGNSGSRNSGDWNSGDGNSGYFNTMVPLYFFNKPSTMVYSQELENKIRSLNVKPIVTWISSDTMTEEEKTNNPSHKVTGGFLRKTNRMNWAHLTEDDKRFILSLPNYDDDIFEKISGVRLLSPKTIKVSHNGQEFEINIEKAKELGIIK